jgi:hypothetical protein
VARRFADFPNGIKGVLKLNYDSDGRENQRSQS